MDIGSFLLKVLQVLGILLLLIIVGLLIDTGLSMIRQPNTLLVVLGVAVSVFGLVFGAVGIKIFTDFIKNINNEKTD